MTGTVIYVRCASCKTLNRFPSDRVEKTPKCGKCKNPLQIPQGPVDATSSSFSHEVLQWPGTVLVEFHAQWCGACRMMKPVLEELSHERAGILKIVMIDVDREPSISAQYRVHATPTLMLFQRGRKVNEIAGALSKEQLREWIDNSLRSSYS